MKICPLLLPADRPSLWLCSCPGQTPRQLVLQERRRGDSVTGSFGRRKPVLEMFVKRAVAMEIREKMLRERYVCNVCMFVC